MFYFYPVPDKIAWKAVNPRFDYLCIMLILLDARPLQFAGPDNERTRLIITVATSLAREQGVKWRWLVDQGWRPGSLPGMIEEEILVRRALPGRAGWRLWYDWQIPRVAKKLRPDWLMLTGGIAAAALPVPQCIWMPVRSDPRTKKTVPLYAGRLGATLRRGDSFLCFSDRDRIGLAGRGRLSEDKFGLVRPMPSLSARPLSTVEREAIKQTYTQGREFFFADASAADEEEIVYLLKAFSLFKKRQLSNLQLVMAGEPSAAVKERLDTYKYRQDVHWHSASVVRDGRLPAAAYAVLILFEDDAAGSQLADAWQTGVPVLVVGGTRVAELAGDAALAAAADDPASLSAHLMMIYKDEVLRGRLIEKGVSRLPEFAPGPTITRLWTMLNSPNTKL